MNTDSKHGLGLPPSRVDDVQRIVENECGAIGLDAEKLMKEWSGSCLTGGKGMTRDPNSVRCRENIVYAIRHDPLVCRPGQPSFPEIVSLLKLSTKGHTTVLAMYRRATARKANPTACV